MKVHPAVSPAIHQFAKIIDENNISIPALADKSGVDYSTIHTWFRKNSPTLINFESVLQAIGYELVIREIDADN
tara:strand:- start:320 stop:541 length:222 start_codon:yes stop_codon:yes gene_type:complete